MNQERRVSTLGAAELRRWHSAVLMWGNNNILTKCPLLKCDKRKNLLLAKKCVPMAGGEWSRQGWHLTSQVPLLK